MARNAVVASEARLASFLAGVAPEGRPGETGVDVEVEVEVAI
jgi:hypothetical protein